MKRAAHLFALLALFSLAHPARADRPPVVAVMPAALDATSPSDDEARAVTAAVREAVADVRRVRALGSEALERLLASAAANGLRCEPSEGDCATRIGAFGAVDFVIVTRLERAPAGDRATVALRDCADGREVRASTALLGGDDALRRAGLAMLARAALGDGEPRGTLVVDAAGGRVLVDGVDRGPGPTELEVPAGLHAVTWLADDGRRAVASVDVPAAARARVPFAAVAGEPAPVGLVSVLAVSGLAVGGAIALGAGVGALVVAPAPDARAEYTAREYNDAVGLGRALLVVSAVGLALAGASGALLALGVGSGGGAGGGDAGGAP